MTARWFRLDAAFQSSPLACRLEERFGPLGVYCWVAFLAACKRAPLPGQISFASEAEARLLLGISEARLVDNKGDEWDLESFWRVLGQLKQTKRTRRGRLLNVRATHWEQWQDDERREDERERQRRLRAKNKRDGPVTPPRHANKNVTPESESESESDFPHTPGERQPPSAAPPDDNGEMDQAQRRTTKHPRRANGTNQRATGANLRALGTNPRALGVNPRAEDPLVTWLRKCVPGTGQPAAVASIGRLRAAGIADAVIEEACGYAAENGGSSARYVETLAIDWMAQRDPTWAPTLAAEPRTIAEAFHAFMDKP